MTKRVYFETYGCTTNAGDTRTMQGILRAEGHELVDSPDQADTIVVNTCTVVDTTDERIGHRLRVLGATGKEVTAAGCMAAAQPERVHRDAAHARLLPPRHLHHIGDVVAGRAYTPRYRPKSGLPRLVTTDAILPLAEGCAFSCSYCLTKTARGDQTSYPIDDLVQDVREAVNAGAVEIKLTAQDVSGYGLDGGARLPELLSRITEIGGNLRVRVGILHPRTAHRILDGLLGAMDSPKVYKFLHLPIQSGSPAVLKAMRRDHTLDEFWAVVEAFRVRFRGPFSTLSTDIITGFPGETEADHRMTLELLSRLRAEHVNITRFSARPGTPAKKLHDRVPTDVAKARSSKITDHALALMAETNRRRVGLEVDAFVVETGKQPGTVVARGPAYEPIGIRGSLSLGSRVRLRIVEAFPTYVVGHPLGPPEQRVKGHPAARHHPA